MPIARVTSLVSHFSREVNAFQLLYCPLPHLTIEQANDLSYDAKDKLNSIRKPEIYSKQTNHSSRKPILVDTLISEILLAGAYRDLDKDIDLAYSLDRGATAANNLDFLKTAAQCNELALKVHRKRRDFRSIESAMSFGTKLERAVKYKQGYVAPTIDMEFLTKAHYHLQQAFSSPDFSPFLPSLIEIPEVFQAHIITKLEDEDLDRICNGNQK